MAQQKKKAPTPPAEKFKRRTKRSPQKSKRARDKSILSEHQASVLASNLTVGDTVASVGSHTTNGVKRYVVHVIDKTRMTRPYTLSY